MAMAMRPMPASVPNPARLPAAPPLFDESLCQKMNAPKSPIGIAATNASKERQPIAVPWRVLMAARNRRGMPVPLTAATSASLPA